MVIQLVYDCSDRSHTRICRTGVRIQSFSVRGLSAPGMALKMIESHTSLSSEHKQHPVLVSRMSNTAEILAKQTTLVNLDAGERNNSLISNYSNYSGENERWSWKALKKEFKAKDVVKMFVKYQARLQHTFFMVLLLLNMFFNITAIMVYFFEKVSQVGPQFVLNLEDN